MSRSSKDKSGGGFDMQCDCGHHEEIYREPSCKESRLFTISEQAQWRRIIGGCFAAHVPFHGTFLYGSSKASVVEEFSSTRLGKKLRLRSELTVYCVRFGFCQQTTASAWKKNIVRDTRTRLALKDGGQPITSLTFCISRLFKLLFILLSFLVLYHILSFISIAL